jgi:two-component system response regulator RegX3
VLVVEDEESFSDAISYMLRKEGFEVAICATGPDALETFDRTGADLVLLDLMLPGLPGSEVCRSLRERSSVPVIMLTAKDSEIDKVVGLELGADDYVTKPFSSRELVARMRAVLRRRGDVEEVAESALEAGPVRMDVERHVVSVRGESVQLPLKEFELLQVLLRNADRVLTRMQLIDRVWGADYVGDTKTLDVHVKRLRAKVETDPAKPRHIVTVRGLGYKFESAGLFLDSFILAVLPVTPRVRRWPGGITSGPARLWMTSVAYCMAATASGAGSRAAREAGIRRARPSQVGIHQLAGPNSATMAGTSRQRTMTASTRMPVPRPVARIFRSVIGPVDMDTKLSIKMAAAPVTSRPVRPRPVMTALRADPVASYSSRIRVRMKTS